MQLESSVSVSARPSDMGLCRGRARLLCTGHGLGLRGIRVPASIPRKLILPPEIFNPVVDPGHPFRRIGYGEPQPASRRRTVSTYVQAFVVVAVKQAPSFVECLAPDHNLLTEI